VTIITVAVPRPERGKEQKLCLHTPTKTLIPHTRGFGKTHWGGGGGGGGKPMKGLTRIRNPGVSRPKRSGEVEGSQRILGGGRKGVDSPHPKKIKKIKLTQNAPQA